MKTLINRLSLVLTRCAERWVPDPMAIAILLTFITLAITFLGGSGEFRYQAYPIVQLWGGGIWKLLPFAMQMCLVLITGHALASTPLVNKLITRLSVLASSPGRAITLTALTAMIAGLINWGLGLIVGAFMAREVGLACQRQGIKVHYPLLGAAGYTGLLVWHGGLSGTAPLKVTQIKDLNEIGSSHQVIPLDETLFGQTNLILIAGLLVIIPIILKLMSPQDPDQIQEAKQWQSSEPVIKEHISISTNTVLHSSFVQRLEQGKSLSMSLGLILFISGMIQVSNIGLSRLNLDNINLLTLSFGLILHPSLKSYLNAAQEAAQNCLGIILQFPIYSGIMALMSGAGLTSALTELVNSVASADSLAILTFLMAGLVNIFVPSGGGQWAVQGPLVLSSAQELNASLGEAVIAFAHGDAWTNLLQPFWALPLLAITGLQAKDIVGYTASLMIILGPWYFFVFWFV